MTKAPKPRTLVPAAPLLDELETPASLVINEPSPDCRVATRDVYAAHALSAIVCGIVQRGGLDALHMALDDDRLMPTVFGLADSAMRVREA